MLEPGRAIRDMRMAARLSVRGLGEAAGVAYTTVFRIEHGEIDPTYSTLQKILGALGAELEIKPGDETEPLDLASLAPHWSTSALGDRPNWPRYRAFLDALGERPERVRRLISRRPDPSGSNLIDNVLAAIAEKCADDAGVRRPAWTRATPALEESYRSDAPAWRRAQARPIPPQFAARGLDLPADSLWRQPVTADA